MADERVRPGSPRQGEPLWHVSSLELVLVSFGCLDQGQQLISRYVPFGLSERREWKKRTRRFDETRWLIAE